MTPVDASADMVSRLDSRTLGVRKARTPTYEKFAITGFVEESGLSAHDITVHAHHISRARGRQIGRPVSLGGILYKSEGRSEVSKSMCLSG